MAEHKRVKSLDLSHKITILKTKANDTCDWRNVDGDCNKLKFEDSTGVYSFSNEAERKIGGFTGRNSDILVLILTNNNVDDKFSFEILYVLI